MKPIKIFLLLCLLLVVSTCKKDPETPSGSNKIEFGDSSIDSIFYFNAQVSTNLTNTGGKQILQHGHCWSKEPQPEIKDHHSSLGSLITPENFTSQIDNLDPNVKYYFRPYVTLQNDTIYGKQEGFTTLKTGKPKLTTSEVANITTISAVSGGTVLSDSGYTVTIRGVCWDTVHDFNVNICLGKTSDGAGSGAFSSNLENLKEGKHYYVKGYAINQAGTNYGEIKQFSTVPITLPTIETNAVTSITGNSAVCGGNITSSGNGTVTVTARGVCWNTTGNPTLDDNLGYTTNGTDIGAFVSYCSGLTPGTPYYVRAYATNSEGTAYGSQVTFMTDSITESSFVCGDAIIVQHTAGSISPVTKEVVYQTLKNIPGDTSKCWIDRNLGADRVALNKNDASEPSAGWYWQFNRKQGYQHSGTARTPSTWVTTTQTSSDWTTANDPCTLIGDGWRLPTSTEWTAVDAGWTSLSNVWSSRLKLHAAGYLYYTTGALNNRGAYGCYWSSTQYNTAKGYNLYFYSASSVVANYDKNFGFTIRCIHN
jgi:uncharacterized protein (TIGR02145 family)